jgi:plasmid replication initiation protein
LKQTIEGEVMKKFFVRLLKKITRNLEKDEKNILVQVEKTTNELPSGLIKANPEEPQLVLPAQIEKNKKPANTSTKTTSKKSIPLSIDPRDILETMEFPFVALSKNRTTPIIYESPDGRSKVRISRHSEHYVASIYDWDIILFVASKMQEILNSGSDIPPRSLIVPRHELLKAIHKHDGKKEENDLRASLARLKLTGIETTIRNEDGRYDAGFGFLDSWGYTGRKDLKEFKITLSQWLYDGICSRGTLLKVDSRYFNITSGLKKFLYRTARKHVGTNKDSWKLSLETLYAKSGSERELKCFKHDLKKAVYDDDIPSYFMNWIEENGNTFVLFASKKETLKKNLLEAPIHRLT